MTNIGIKYLHFHRPKSRLEIKYTNLRKRINKLRKDNYKLLFSPETHIAKTVQDLEQQLKMMSDQIQKDKNKHLSQKVNKSLVKNDTRKLFSTVKRFNEDYQPKRDSTIKALHTRSGELVNSTDDIIRTLHDFWDNLFQRNSPINFIEFEPTLHRILNTLPPYKNSKNERDYFFKMFPNGEDLDELADEITANHTDKNYSPLCDEPISFHEVHYASKSLSKNKSIGPDNIPPEFFMRPSATLKRNFAKLFSKILATNACPEEWKYDRRRPIQKSGNKLDRKNIRWIAVHSVFRKLFAKIIDKRIRSFVEIQDSQAGFRPARRTSDQALFYRILYRCRQINANKTRLY